MDNRWKPFIYSALIAIGVLAGMALRPSGNGMSFLSSGNSSNKFDEVLKLVDNMYVDTINYEKLEDEAVNGFLSKLDPHSVYISASDLKSVNEQLDGNFEGIGIEFNIVDDTLMVVTPISGGPSHQLGILAGDRIVKVEGKSIAGTGIKNEDVAKLLKGKKGTKVKVSILRRGVKNLIEYNITRNTIPIYSIEAAYKLNSTTGYIKVNRFAATTYAEFSEALMRLTKQDITGLVIDLRGNPGGYLEEVTKMVDELLEDDKLIVYTEGRSTARNDYNTRHKGLFEQGNLVVLIDESSASASEILSGAIQDWDRGVIVGRRSFGKGLVQQPFSLKDGSSVRLTVSRYYTPSGRCIQKPYEDDITTYERELSNRFAHGELANEDSASMNKGQMYKTSNGRPVYGGGGIKPDVFVPIDTTFSSPLLTGALSEGLFSKFAFSYVDAHNKQLKEFLSVEEFDKVFDRDKAMYKELQQFIQKSGVKGSEADWKRSGEWMYTLTRALIARQLWKDNGYYYVLNKTDKTVKKALEVINTPARYLQKQVGK